MATGTISNIIKDPSGTPVPDAEVIIRLYPNHAWRSDDTEIYPEKRLVSDASGAWTAVLEKNTDITPSGNYYEIEERLEEGSRIWRVWSTGVVTLLQASDPNFQDPIGYGGGYALAYDGVA